MTERVHIRQRYREEFEQVGEIDLRKRLEAGQFDGDKRKAGWAWLDEKAHGEERAYKARQLALQERNDLKTSISLGFALIALVISGVALYQQLASKHSDATTHYAETLKQPLEQRRGTMSYPEDSPAAIASLSGNPAGGMDGTRQRSILAER